MDSRKRPIYGFWYLTQKDSFLKTILNRRCSVHNPYRWILGKKSKTRDCHRARFPEKSRAQRCIICMFLGFGFCAVDFFGNRARWWSQKWHIFLFSMAYFPSYWHMPFEIGIMFHLLSTTIIANWYGPSIMGVWHSFVSIFLFLWKIIKFLNIFTKNCLS